MHCLCQGKVDYYINGNFLLPESVSGFLFVHCLLTIQGETLLVWKRGTLHLLLEMHTVLVYSQSVSIQLLSLTSTWGCVLEKAGNNGGLVSFFHSLSPVLEALNLFFSSN